MRIPFETVALEDAKIFIFAGDIGSAIGKYYSLLDICGWSITEYEKELLTRVDKEWTLIHKKVILIPIWLSN